MWCIQCMHNKSYCRCCFLVSSGVVVVVFMYIKVVGKTLYKHCLLHNKGHVQMVFSLYLLNHISDLFQRLNVEKKHINDSGFIM